MFHIVESCPLTKLNGGLSRLHSADEDAVSWLTSYGSRHAYEKKMSTYTKFDPDRLRFAELIPERLIFRPKSNYNIGFKPTIT